MAKCAACGKFLAASAAVMCTTCPGTFHKGCVVIPEAALVPKDWICPECKKKQRKGDNSCTPVKGLCGSQAPSTVQDAAAGSNSKSCSPTKPTNTTDNETREMRLELAGYMQEIREMRKELGEIKGIRSDVTAIQESLNLNLINMTDRLDGFDKRLVSLESRTDTSSAEQVTRLEETVAQLRSELNDRDQEVLLSDLDIGHLPEEKGENVQHTVIVLAAKLGVTLEERDIVFAERVGPAERRGVSVSDSSGDSQSVVRGRRVVVRLARRQTRDDLLRAARVRRNVTSADFGQGGAPRRVYVNERLTRLNRQLFQHVREECRRLQWRYSWTRRGRIFARQGDGQQAYSIRTEADLVRVFGTPIV